MLRCELENQKNDRKEDMHQLDEANKKIGVITQELEQTKKDLAQLKDEELERLENTNFCQEKEILKV